MRYIAVVPDACMNWTPIYFKKFYIHVVKREYFHYYSLISKKTKVNAIVRLSKYKVLFENIESNDRPLSIYII